MKNALLIVLVFQFFGFLAFSADDPKTCSEQNIDTSSLPKNRDQKATGWCFGYAATDLISYNLKTPVSVYDVVANYYDSGTMGLNKAKDNMYLGGGTVSNAVLEAIDKPLCLEKDVDYTNGQWDEMSEYIQFLSKPSVPMDEMACTKWGENSGYRGLSADIQKILNAEQDGGRKLTTFFAQTCKKKGRVFELEDFSNVGTDFNATQERKMANIDKGLELNQPVAISYSSRVFFADDFTYEDTTKPPIMPWMPHASTIIARKYNPSSKSCEYLIRNSWGTDCQRHVKDFKKGLSKQVSCKDGNYWVPRARLHEAVRSSLYLYPSK